MRYSTTNTKLYYSSTNVEYDVPQQIQSCTNPRRMSDEMFHTNTKLYHSSTNVEYDVPQRIQSCTTPRRMSDEMFHDEYKVVLILNSRLNVG